MPRATNRLTPPSETEAADMVSPHGIASVLEDQLEHPDYPGLSLFDEDDQADFGFYELDATEEKVNVLYYGREGTGKTTDGAFMANLPNATRVLIINAEAGTKKVALARRGIDTSKIVMWPRPGTKITFDALEALHRKVLSDLDTDPNSWTGVMFDSVTEIATTIREQATDARYQKLDRRGVAYDDTETDVGDYTVLGDQMRKILRRFRDLPCHFVATALEREDQKTGTIGPDLTPAVARAILGYVDFALYCRADVEVVGEETDDHGAEFRALTRANSKYRAKDRFDVTPKVLAEPTFLRLLGYIEGELDENTDELQRRYNERREEKARAAAEAAAAKEAAKAAARENKKKAN